MKHTSVFDLCSFRKVFLSDLHLPRTFTLNAMFFYRRIPIHRSKPQTALPFSCLAILGTRLVSIFAPIG
jgi:hypothetical protein